MRVRLWWTHGELDPAELDGWAVAVVDCLRATTTICAALAAGCAAVVPLEEEGAARRRAAADGAVLAGERACLPPPGFDLGNSPGDFRPAVVAGREVVLWTTNGSRALAKAAASQAGLVLAFALVNAAATARHLAHADCPRLAIVCAGTEGGFALDDAFAAGALLERLSRRHGVALALDDAAGAALFLYRGAGEGARAVLDGSAAAARLRERALEADIAFAAREDAIDVVAVWESGALRAAAPGA